MLYFYHVSCRNKLRQNIQAPIKLPVKYHIAMTSQLEEFVNQINVTHACTMEKGCKGKCEI